MAHLGFYNAIVDINERFYDSHVDIITKVCNDLGHSDRVKEMVTKYLDEGTKLKAKKDKNHPKKPRTSFLFFTMQNRERVKDSNPNIAVSDIYRVLGKEWGSLSNEEKQKFEELASSDKQRYRAELEAYHQALFHSETGV